MDKIPKQIREKILYFEGALQNLRQAQDDYDSLKRRLARAEQLVEEKRIHAENAVQMIRSACDEEWKQLPFIEKQRGTLHPWSIVKSSLLSKIKKL